MKPEGEIRLYHSGAIPYEVDLYLHTYEGMAWIKRRLRGQSGWLQVAKASMDTFWGSHTAMLVVAVTDHGELLDRTVSHALLDMKASGVRDAEIVPDEELDGHMEMAFWDFLGRCDLYHLRMLDEAEIELASELEREQTRGEKVLTEVDNHIADLGRQRRAVIVDDARQALAVRIALLEEKQAEAAAWLVRRLATMRKQGEALQDDLLAALQNHGELEVLYSVRWVAKHAFDRVYRRQEPNFLINGRNQPVNNPLAERLLAQLRLRDDETDDERRERKDREQNIRRERWNNRLLVKTKKERERDRLNELAELNKISQKQTLTQRRMQQRAALRAAQASQKAEMALEAEKKRVSQNAERLRTEAQRRSAKRQALNHQREREIAALLDDYPTVAELERELERLPGTGIENRRLARLLRKAIQRMTASKTMTVPEAQPAFRNDTIMRTNTQKPVDAPSDDSIDIDALIEAGMRDMLKDLR